MTANTTTMKNTTLNITLTADVDWEWDSATEIASVPQFNELSKLGCLFIESMEFEPNAAGDKISVREGSLTGPVIFHASAEDTYAQKIHYFNGAKVDGLYIDKDDVTSDSDAAMLILRIA